MQPQSLLSFLGASPPSQEGEAGGDHNHSQGSSGFGSMLVGAFELLTDHSGTSETDTLFSSALAQGSGVQAGSASHAGGAEAQADRGENILVGKFGPLTDDALPGNFGTPVLDSGVAASNADSNAPVAAASGLGVNANTFRGAASASGAGANILGADAARLESSANVLGADVNTLGPASQTLDADATAPATESDESPVGSDETPARMTFSGAKVAPPQADQDASRSAELELDSAIKADSEQALRTSKNLDSPAEHESTPREKSDVEHDSARTTPLDTEYIEGHQADLSTQHRSTKQEESTTDERRVQAADLSPAHDARSVSPVPDGARRVDVDLTSSGSTRSKSVATGASSHTPSSTINEPASSERQGESSNPAARSEGSHRLASVETVKSDHAHIANLERTSRHLTGQRIRIWRENSAPSPGRATVEIEHAIHASAEQGAGDQRSTNAARSDVRRAADASATNDSRPGAGRAIAPDEVPKVDEQRDAERSETRGSSTRSTDAESESHSGAGGGSDFTGESEFVSDPEFELPAAGEELTDFALPDADDVISLDGDALFEGTAEATADELTYFSERASTTTSLSSLDLARRGGRPDQARTAAWLQSILSNGLKSETLDKGWRVIEMQLGEGQGTMTVRARRDDDKVSIAVTFSDPQLRNLAAENLDRLQHVLRDQYETTVDFSLTSDHAGDTPQRRDDAPTAHEASPDRVPRADAVSTLESVHAARTVLAGARNEWIG